MKNKYILFFIIFVLILIWFFLLYNIRNNNIESFTSSDNIYAKNKILNNCNLTWGKKNKNQGLCNSSSWVSDPNLLCGICGLDHNNPLYSLKNNDGSTLYGCNENNPNPYQLSWNSKGIQTTKVNEVISDILTCNSYNYNLTSDMIAQIPADFNLNYYKILNSDLKNLTDIQLIYHYLNNGIREKRKYGAGLPPDFDLIMYKNLNNDLKNLTDAQLIYHYLNNGIREKRKYK